MKILIFLFVCFYSMGQSLSPIFPTGNVGDKPYFSRNGKIIITNIENCIKIWDSKSGKLLFQDICFLGDNYGILKTEISPDGTKVLLQKNNKIILYSLQKTVKLITELELQNDENIAYFEFSSNSNNILIKGEEHSIVIWDANTGKEEFKIIKEGEGFAKDANGDEIKLNRIWDAHINNDGETFTIWNFPIIETWSFKKKSKIYTIKTISDTCNDDFFLFSDNDEHFFYENELYETKTGKKVATFKLKECLLVKNIKSKLETIEFFKPISISNNEDRFGRSCPSIIGDTTFIYHIYNTNLVKKTFVKYKKPIKYEIQGFTCKMIDSDTVFSPNEKIYLTTKDGIKAWDANSNLPLYTLKTVVSPLTNITLNPNGKYILFQKIENNYPVSSILNLEKGEVSIGKINTSEGGYYLSLFNKTGEKQISLNWHGPPVEYNESNNQIITYKRNREHILSNNLVVQLNNDKNLLLVGSQAGDLYKESSKIEVWNSENRSLFSPILNFNNRIGDAKFNLDATKIAASYYRVNGVTGDAAYSIVIWDILTGQITQKLIESYGMCANTEIHFSPNGKFLAVNICDKIKIWDSSSWKLIRTIEVKAERIEFSGDSNYILSLNSHTDSTPNKIGNGESITTVWQITTGQQINKLIGHNASTSIFDETSQYIFTNNKNIAQIWDWKNNIKIDLPGHNNLIQSIKYNPHQKRIYTFSKDGSNKIWDATNGQLICTFYILGEKDYFFQLPTGYYKCSQNAEKLMHYVIETNRIITFEQLSAKFNRPDLVLKALGNINPKIILGYKLAYLKRIKKLGINDEFINNEKNTSSFSLPEINILNESEIEYYQSKSAVQLKIVGESKTTIKKINIWINEVPIYGRNGIVLTNKNKLKIDTLLNIPLQLDINVIEVSINDINGLESFREKISVFYKPKTVTNSKLYFVGIGVDHFLDNDYDLSFCIKDIRDLANILKIKYNNQIEIDTLFGTNVTVNNVRKLKSKLNNTRVDDKVIIAYSGHGLLNKDLEYFLSTYNMNFEKPEINGLRYEEIEDLMDGIPSRKKLLLIDACHSGEIDEEDFGKLDSTGLIKGIKPKLIINDNKNRIGLSNSIEIVKNVFTDVSKGTGAKIISASAGNQYALEKKGLKNGVFTYAILEAMKKYEYLTVNKLKEVVEKRVLELTNGLQTPTTRKDVIYFDWNIYNTN